MPTYLETILEEVKLESATSFSERMCRHVSHWMRRSLRVEPFIFRMGRTSANTKLKGDPDRWKSFLSTTPAPLRFIRIQPGSSLLKLAGEAYVVRHGDVRLALAQWINCHPFNRRFWRRSASRWWPGGRISFLPHFEAQHSQVETFLELPDGRVRRGGNFAVVWIPERPTVLPGRLPLPKRIFV